MKLKLENLRISLWNIFLEKMEMAAYGSALKSTGCYHEKFHSDLNEAVYYCFESPVDLKSDLNELEIISSLYNFSYHGLKKFEKISVVFSL